MIFLLAVASALEISYFNTGMFEKNRDPGLYQVDIGLEEQDLILSSFGYFNKDKYCDILALTGDLKSLIVFLWDNSELRFYASPTLRINGTGLIQSAIPGDYNYDGQLDVLITYTDGSKYMQLFLQSSASFSPQTAILIPDDSQPAVFDVDGDMKLEVLNNLNDSVQVFKFDSSLTEFSGISKYWHNDKSCLSYAEISFSYPHSIGFVDLNKDCLADLFMTVIYQGKKYFEIWLNAMDGTYCKVFSEPAAEGARQVSFADIDRDGIEDIIYPVCLGASCSIKNEIHIIYNLNEVSNDCSFSFEKLKTFELKDFSSTEETRFKSIIELKDPFYENENRNFPISVRFGDFDLDGFPDALVVLQNSSDSYVQYLKNTECHHCKARRKLEIDTNDDLEKLKNVKNAALACFFDLDDKGVLDIIVLSYNGSYEVTSFYNNFQNDAFHLKALTLNGHARGGYSSSYPGAVFMFTLTELDMSKVIIHSTQMPLGSFYALNTPYCVFGLGRTNSYIEEFYAALPLKSNNFRFWTPVIPNSYLIVSPDTGSSENWYLELFASPTDQIGIIIAVCCICMVLIGIVVALKYYKEKKEDRKLFGIKF